MSEAISHHPAKPLKRSHMPADFDISLKQYTNGFTTRIPDDFGPRQPMTGFEDTYHNIVDYIVRITYRIWEDRDVEYIGKTYAPDSWVFDDFGLQIGNKRIIENTYRTTGSFSDIVLDATEVIWAGDDGVGFRSSHRLNMIGTNDGDGDYGPATNRKIDFMVMANCVTKGNVIFLEQVLYNSAALMLQLGLDPWEQARKLAENPAHGWPRDEETWQRLKTEGAPEKPLCEAEPVDGFDPDLFCRELHDLVWQKSDFERAGERYESDVVFESASLIKGTGFEAYQGMVTSITNCLDQISFSVDETYWMGNEADRFLVSTRWSMDAVHASAGHYGEPSGAQVQIWGITQQEIKDGKVVAEWVLFNEFDLMIQIEAARRKQGAKA